MSNTIKHQTNHTINNPNLNPAIQVNQVNKINYQHKQLITHNQTLQTKVGTNMTTRITICNTITEHITHQLHRNNTPNSTQKHRTTTQTNQPIKPQTTITPSLQNNKTSSNK